MADNAFSIALGHAQEMLVQGAPRAAEAAFRALAAEHVDGAKILALDGLGRCLHAQGRLEEAECAFTEALELLRSVYGPHHAHVAGGLQNVARLRSERGDWAGAIALGREALDILDAALGPEHPAAAGARLNLSSHHYAAEDFDGAEALLRAAMSAWEKTSGSRSLEVSTCLNNLGRIYERRGDSRSGAALHRQAADIRQALLGDHPETAFSLGNLGAALAGDGQWLQAAEALEAALACHQRLGSTDGEEARICRANLELCRRAANTSS